MTWPTCDLKALKRHKREYNKLSNSYRGCDFIGLINRMGILDNLILQIQIEIDNYDDRTDNTRHTQ